MWRKSIIILLIIINTSLKWVYAQYTTHPNDQENFTPYWQVHLGIGLGLTANGLPSQLANQLAKKEGFISSVKQPRGLPLFIQAFGGVSYNFTAEHQLGTEISLSLGMDGGRTRLTLGSDPKNIPGYVFDSSYGSNKELDFFSSIQKIYPGLSTITTLKGYYLDPKIRLYYRYYRSLWSLQAGVGAGLIIPFSYFAYPSKNIDDYQGASKEVIASLWQAGVTQGSIGATRIPFPLVMRNGRTIMQAIQPLLDLHLRVSLQYYYIDITYATEFHFIHQVKLGLGIQFL